MGSISYVKGHGLGNSFLVVESDPSTSGITPDVARQLCAKDRYDVDGILMVAGGDPPFMHILNSDGSVPEMCGNGVRVVAQYLVNHRGAPESFVINTLAGEKAVAVRRESIKQAWVSVDMGVATVLDPLDGEPHRISLDTAYGREELVGYRVDMGNPHFVVLPENDESVVDRVLRLGPLLEVHADFPARTNVECIQMNGDGSVEVAVWERGCGFTQACGTGACASIAVTAGLGWAPFDTAVSAWLPGGSLEIEVRKSDFGLRMAGPAVEVEQGTLDLSG
ncbi:MAG: diaminopimelate epimerase [Myxococcales bacterium]|nr:diaminopimelate epimerase [Myxococcales bacterium]|tara:strand:- start:787 stop:1623 length:837 start_codon:yes stop_codon:yes gene_type:complete